MSYPDCAPRCQRRPAGPASGEGTARAPRSRAAQGWAAGCLFQYAKETQRSDLPHLQGIQVEQPGDCVILDAASRRNLEIDTNLSGGTNNTLLSVLDTQELMHPIPTRLLIHE